MSIDYLPKHILKKLNLNLNFRRASPSVASVLHGWDSVLWFATPYLFFPPNKMTVIMTKKSNRSFIWSENVYPKTNIIISMYSCKPLAGFFLFYFSFAAVTYYWADFSRFVDLKFCFTLNIDIFLSSIIFIRSVNVVFALFAPN